MGLIGEHPTGKQNKNQLLLFQPDLEKHVFCVNIHHPIHHPGSFKSLPAYNASQLPTEKALGGRKQLEMPPEMLQPAFEIITSRFDYLVVEHRPDGVSEAHYTVTYWTVYCMPVACSRAILGKHSATEFHTLKQAETSWYTRSFHHEFSLCNILFPCYFVLGRRTLLSTLLLIANVNIHRGHEEAIQNFIFLCISAKAWAWLSKTPRRALSYFEHSPCLCSVLSLSHSITQPTSPTIFSQVLFRLGIPSIFCQLPS
ncbi:uncharacterized protein LOC116897736 [Rattus rattus]|uniref:uncharacterized protein LOC116897736 n=1 Tax=Rattus rattus TaxID=10117 RepID=UPI0013F30592|nr:uncharacterized protein LOC116897736 [Rattus rattus]